MMPGGLRIDLEQCDVVITVLDYHSPMSSTMEILDKNSLGVLHYVIRREY
jgi:hypothetical protein